MLRIVSLLFLSGFLSSSCQNSSDNNKSTSSAGIHACSVQRDGALTICTEYKDLSGTNLTTIQSDCELKKGNGYSWAVSSCQDTGRVGSCSLAATTQRPAASTQFYFSPIFTSDVAQGMCTANDGTFTKI